MKLTEDQAKEIVKKVFKDLKMECHDKYPIKVFFHEKSEKNIFL